MLSRHQLYAMIGVDFEIRQIEKADEEQWRELFRGYCDFYRIKLDPQIASRTWERFFDTSVPMHASVAVSQNKVIGFVHWITHLTTLSMQDYIYLHDLYVDPVSRCNGVGRRLIEAVYEAGDKLNAAKIYWQTQVRQLCGNPRSAGLTGKFGRDSSIITEHSCFIPRSAFGTASSAIRDHEEKTVVLPESVTVKTSSSTSFREAASSIHV